VLRVPRRRHSVSVRGSPRDPSCPRFRAAGMRDPTTIQVGRGVGESCKADFFLNRLPRPRSGFRALPRMNTPARAPLLARKGAETPFGGAENDFGNITRSATHRIQAQVPVAMGYRGLRPANTKGKEARAPCSAPQASGSRPRGPSCPRFRALPRKNPTPGAPSRAERRGRLQSLFA